jgi:hypothetical protein
MPQDNDTDAAAPAPSGKPIYFCHDCAKAVRDWSETHIGFGGVKLCADCHTRRGGHDPLRSSKNADRLSR